MSDYKIEVKSWMLKKSSDSFTFMRDRNGDIPMPLMVMYGTKIGEAPKMIKVKLHGDIRERIITRCMCCGRPITNKVSQYFGIGPKCGGHNYINPFETEEELNEAVSSYRNKLINTTWIGWIPYSALVSIDDDTDVIEKSKEMPFEVVPESEYLLGGNSDKNMPVIKARIDKPIKGTDDYSVFLSFRYNPTLKDVLKENTRVHAWIDSAKEWEIEYREFDKVQKLLSELDYRFDITGEELLPEKVEVSDDFDFKTKPMTHQIEGVQYGLDHNRWLLADDQGLGKTFQVINLACIRKQTLRFKHCLIICGVNSLKWNWLEEIEKHSNETGHILGSYTSKRSGKTLIGSNADKLADLEKLGEDSEIDSHYFIITNIESLRDTKIASKLKELCDNGTIGMVAVDEIHRAKRLTTQQGQGMLQLQPKYRIGMTGTPLMNSPLDLFAILKWLGYQRYGFISFRDHFCIRDEWGAVVGYKNISQLEDQLDSVMLRRTKDKVLDLPDKVYVNEYVDLTSEQKKLYNEIISNAVASSESDNKDCILATLLRLRQVSGGIGPYNFIKFNPKLDRLEQIVEEAVYSNTKVIVYSNWVEGIKPALERLQKYNPVVITGETADADRQTLVNKFQTDDTCKVILGTIGALGTGVTLTAATEVVFLDEPWNNATKEQACDRAYRIGTTSKVTIRTILSHGTYDEDVHNIILGKKDLSDAIVDKDALAKMRIA